MPFQYVLAQWLMVSYAVTAVGLDNVELGMQKLM